MFTSGASVQYETEKDGKFLEQQGLKGMQMVQFECPSH